MDGDAEKTGTPKPRRTRGGISPHIGFRIDKDLSPRLERLSAAFAAAQPLLPAPDRSAVMNAIVRQGILVCEAQLGLPPLPGAAPPAEAVSAPSASRKRAARSKRSKPNGARM